jgi:O-antigen/teichoic acid export membrane protein
VVVATSLVFGFLGWGANGLLASYLIGQLATALMTYTLLLALRPEFGRMRLRRLRALLAHNHRYPLFSLPSEMISQVSMQLPAYALTALGAGSELGAFGRARGLVALPITLVGASIGQVFRQRAAEEQRRVGHCRSVYVKTFVALSSVSIPAGLFLWLSAPWLFRVFLGPNWVEAGRFAQILAPMLILRMITAPLANMFNFTGAQRDGFILMTCGFALIALAVGTAILLQRSPQDIVAAYSWAYCVLYLSFLVRSFILSGRRISRARTFVAEPAQD